MGSTNLMSGSALAHRTTAAVPFGSVLAVSGALPPSHIVANLGCFGSGGDLADLAAPGGPRQQDPLGWDYSVKGLL